jgi:hypothetical protein
LPLGIAYLTSAADVTAFLLDNGADPDMDDDFGRTALHHATYRTLEHVKQVVANNGDLTAVDRMGRNVLHCAVVSGRASVVRYILEKTPSLVNEADKSGWTPLLWALRRCSLWDIGNERAQIIDLLLDATASRLIVGEGPGGLWTPVQVGRHYGLPEDIIQKITPSTSEVESAEELLRARNWTTGTRRANSELDGVFCDACFLVSDIRISNHAMATNRLTDSC